ncbi:unknown protein [Microcystis aeruginosa NIES-843]|uniref:Uncharacterized protein n=1 Tax=Microcystis aeruginosa (strain NIES-843 / IAM M-2473) TaxID=449447 RepID=B0JKG7_MICAN|nr:unknown protein [Microcystis aeruginosa NIES-843]
MGFLSWWYKSGYLDEPPHWKTTLVVHFIFESAFGCFRLPKSKNRIYHGIESRGGAIY